jgi:prepilin-type N-terminal cleavage/methylation domain-containing protein
MRITKRSRSRGGFTLIELMITTALIGTIAAIAIPNFNTYQARSRRSEGMTNTAGIARAYKTYYADRGRYPDSVTDGGAATLPVPGAGQPNTTKMAWTTADTFFGIVGWRPDGNVFYTYEVESNCAGLCSNQDTCFTIVAHGDVDGKNGMGAVMYVHPMKDAGGGVVASCPSFLGYAAPVQQGVTVYDAPAVYMGTDLY